MELYETQDYYIIQDGDYGLWADRRTGSLEAKSGEDLCKAWNPVCLGLVHGIIGKAKILPDSAWRLLLIREKEAAGCFLDGNEVFRIGKIAVLPLTAKTPPSDFNLPMCKKHHFGISKPKQITHQGRHLLQQIGNSIKVAKENIQHTKANNKEIKDHDKLEKKILEELTKMFNISDFYYFCETADLTNTVQRQNLPSYDKALPVWKRADERFFWNKTLLQDLINSNNPLADHWIQPVIQGYYDIRTCSMADGNTCAQLNVHQDVIRYTIALLSRRSRHRTGTRYKRRGVDETGACANYVETEQIISFQQHVVSYTQVRGSIPVFWSQPGHKYRPPPILDKGEKETEVAFSKHFEDQLSLYKQITCLSLIDEAGREKVVGDAFLHHILLYNNPSVAYVTFDFHEYCRGMQFDNVQILMEAVKEIFRDQKYCWVDDEGMICEQNGIFRVNCIDCLDRTNIVQTTVAKIILDQQIRKLGLLTPDDELPEACRLVFNQLWANNGDAISRQYAGTAAMKGDYTRTGERKFSGLMRDGVKSANRYLIHRFKDMYRQAAIDIQMGHELEQDIQLLLARDQQVVENQQDEIDYIREKASDVASVIEEGRNLLIPESEQYVGGWGVISLDEGETGQDEMDTILLLSDKSYYVLSFDDERDCLTDYQPVPIEELYAIEIGLAPTSVFRPKYLCIRLWYRNHGEAGYFHTFKVPNVRAFNNTVIEVKNDEEVKEILRAIAETFRVTCSARNGLVNVTESKIEGKRFRAVTKRSIQTTSIESTVWTKPQRIANMASSAVTKAANKAANNVKKQFANLNKKMNLSPRHTSLAGSLSATFSKSDTGDSRDDVTEILVSIPAVSEEIQSNGNSAGYQTDGSLMEAMSFLSESENSSRRNSLLRHSLSGSLPDLSPQTLSIPVVPEKDLHGSSPLVCVDDKPSLQPTLALAFQTHHSTAPCLNDLATDLFNGTEKTDYSQLQIRTSASDDGIRNHADILANKSPLSKIRSGLSQVSQLIGSQSGSPQQRRKRQLLEMKVNENLNRSMLRFRECRTKIMIL